MQNIQIFNYKNTEIEFEVINGEVFANATAMCQAFNKMPYSFLRLESTNRYLEALREKNAVEYIVTKNGGTNPGTWIHEKLIIRLASWLDVNFELWCDERIAELLRTGKVEVKPKTQAELFLESAQMLVQQEQRINACEAKQSEQDNRLLQIEAKNATRPDYFTVVGYATLQKKKVGLSLAAAIGKKSSGICEQKGYHIEKVTDPRFGHVNSYPSEVLQIVFSSFSLS